MPTTILYRFGSNYKN